MDMSLLSQMSTVLALADYEDAIVHGMKSFADRAVLDSDHIWLGVSHNAWLDRGNDIIPLALIEEDIARQSKAIESGEANQFGLGLWVDHKPKKIIGDCQVRFVLPGGRSCFEVGNIDSREKGIKAHDMSMGYYVWKSRATGEYTRFLMYERSALVDTVPVNTRTFFVVKPRMKDSQIAQIAQELHGQVH